MGLCKCTRSKLFFLLPSQVNGESFAELQKYVLKRLITGLSSSRQAAALGFATVLCEVLKLLKSTVDVRNLLTSISEYLKATKQDSRAVS